MPPPTPISTDLPCITCHYNLRTLSPTALCPECATPIRESINSQSANLSLRPNRITVACILLASLGVAGAATSVLVFRMRNGNPWHFLHGEMNYFIYDHLSFVLAVVIVCCFFPAALLLQSAARPTATKRSKFAWLPYAAILLCALNLVVTVALLWQNNHPSLLPSDLPDDIPYEFNFLFVLFKIFSRGHPPFAGPYVFLVLVFHLTFLPLLYFSSRWYLTMSRSLRLTKFSLLSILWLSATLVLPCSDLFQVAMLFLDSHLPAVARSLLWHTFIASTTIRYLTFYLAQILYWPILALAVHFRIRTEVRE